MACGADWKKLEEKLDSVIKEPQHLGSKEKDYAKLKMISEYLTFYKVEKGGSEHILQYYLQIWLKRIMEKEVNPRGQNQGPRSKISFGVTFRE